MALRTFETDTAQYYLGLGRHDRSSAPIFEDVDLKKLDFLVLEGDGSIFRSPSDIFALPQYAEFEELQQQFHFPIYLVDLGTLPETNSGRVLTMLSESPVYMLGTHLLSKSIKRGKDKTKMSRRELFRRVGQGMVGTALFSPGLELMNSSKGDITPITEISNLRTNVLPTYFLSFRDAVTAKKISKYLVPQHPNGSKVQVGIIYGAMHSGIETKLRHPWIADATIGLYHDLLGIGDNDFLNQVIKVAETGSMVYHDSGLFK